MNSFALGLNLAARGTDWALLSSFKVQACFVEYSGWISCPFGKQEQ